MRRFNLINFSPSHPVQILIELFSVGLQIRSRDCLICSLSNICLKHFKIFLDIFAVFSSYWNSERFLPHCSGLLYPKNHVWLIRYYCIARSERRYLRACSDYTASLNTGKLEFVSLHMQWYLCFLQLSGRV